MAATPQRSASEAREVFSQGSPADHTIELVAPLQTSRADDALAVIVAGTLGVTGVFLSWVLLAPGALDVLK